MLTITELKQALELNKIELVLELNKNKTTTTRLIELMSHKTIIQALLVEALEQALVKAA